MTTPSSDFALFLADFRATILDATVHLRNVTEEESRLKPSSDAWSPIEVVGHLVDSAANNHQRFVRHYVDHLRHHLRQIFD